MASGHVFPFHVHSPSSPYPVFHLPRLIICALSILHISFHILVFIFHSQFPFLMFHFSILHFSYSIPRIPFHLQVFTSETMLKYLRVFNLLWRAKRMEHCLANMWRDQMSHHRTLQTIPGEMEPEPCTLKLCLVVGTCAHHDHGPFNMHTHMWQIKNIPVACLQLMCLCNICELHFQHKFSDTAL